MLATLALPLALCSDCVARPNSTSRSIRGAGATNPSGSFNSPIVSYRYDSVGNQPASYVGVRCARTP